MAIGFAILLTLLGKIGALLRDIALSFGFGAGPQTDAYFIANLIPGLMWAAISVSIPSVLIPIYLARGRSRAEAERLLREAIRLYCFAGALAMVFAYFLANQIVGITAPDASATVRNLAVSLTRIMALGFCFTAYVGVQNALQQAHGRYLAPLTVPVVNHSITIAAILIAAHYGSIGIAVAGAVLGWAVQAPIQRWHTRDLYRFLPGWRVRRETWQKIALLSGPIAVGVFLDQVNIYVGIAVAARFEEGAISHLSYASRLALFLANLVSWLVAYFLFPRLASEAASRDDAGSARTLGAGIVIITAFTAPMMAMSLLFGPEIIHFIYARGAFGEASVAATAAVFAPLLIGALFIGLREMLNRVFFSYQRVVAPLVIGIMAAIVNLGVSLWLSRTLGLVGIAIGASAAAFVFVALQLAVLATWRRGLLDVRAFGQAGALCLAAACAYVGGAWMMPWIGPLHYLIRLAIGCLFVGGIYVVAAAVFDKMLCLRLTAIAHLFTSSNSKSESATPLDQRST